MDGWSGKSCVPELNVERSYQGKLKKGHPKLRGQHVWKSGAADRWREVATGEMGRVLRHQIAKGRESQGFYLL